MSHIIIDAKFEELVEKLVSYNTFVDANEAVVLINKQDYDLPLIFAASEEGVVVKVGNGSQHLDQGFIQEVIAEFVAGLPFFVKRSTISRKVLRKYGISYS